MIDLLKISSLLNDWEEVYFTDPILSITTGITLCISLSKTYSYAPLKIFPYYLASFILLSLDIYIMTVFELGSSQAILMKIENSLSLIVTLLELICFSYFFLFLISNNLIKKLIKIITSIFSLYTIIYGITNHPAPVSFLHRIYTIESCILLSFCLLYVFQIILDHTGPKTTSEAHFWVVCGLFFYVLVTFPLTLITDYFFETDKILYRRFYSIIYFAYTILYGMIIIGYIKHRKSLVLIKSKS